MYYKSMMYCTHGRLDDRIRPTRFGERLDSHCLKACDDVISLMAQLQQLHNYRGLR